MTAPKKVLVIGAGAGGLVTLKTLLDASQQDPTHPLDPLLVEAEAEIGGTFRCATTILVSGTIEGNRR